MRVPPKPLLSFEALEAEAFKKLSQMNEGNLVKPSDEALRIAARIMASRALRTAEHEGGASSCTD